MAFLEEIDSGMESLKDGDSKSNSPELPPGAKWAHEIEEDDEDFEDESLLERLAGLSEMFPDSLVNGSKSLVSWSTYAVKGLIGFGRSAAWVVFSSSVILAAPLVFELERCRVLESQKQHQRQMLLGPGAALGGGAAPGMMPPMGMMPPPPSR